MSKNRKTDGADFERLKGAGLEFQSPQDEFSYQPDSGGRPNGKVGRQESGTDIDLDAESHLRTVRQSSPVVGESVSGTQGRMPDERVIDFDENETEDDDLVEMIYDRLSKHPQLESLQIGVSSRNAVVTLSGDVSSLAEKQHAADIAEAIPGVLRVTNSLKVSPIK